MIYTLISVAILIFIIGLMSFKIVNERLKQKNEFTKPKNTKEWHEVKYSNGFVLLYWDELIKWEKSSEKEKHRIFYNQQSLIKRGLVKIVKENGEKRLVSNIKNGL